MKSRYLQIEKGQWVEPPMGSFGIACCDCGLVHRVLVRKTKAGKIEMKMARDNRATGQYRRHHDITIREIEERKS